VRVTALTWNLFHGRDHPPDAGLLTLRSRLLRAPARNATHRQVNRDLLPEFTRVLFSADWDVALLQECPPRWRQPLAEAAGGDHHISLTSRNSLPRLRAAVARLNPDLIASNEGGSNLILIRGNSALGRITDRRELVLNEGTPERRTMAFARTAAGLCVANIHATVRRPEVASAEVLRAAAAATGWAEDSPLLLGGDFNLSPGRAPHLFAALEEQHALAPATSERAIDHLLIRGAEVPAPPGAWPARRREVDEDGLAVRLSDHAPVQGTYEVPG
jgi:endonuclease/exonuclease/phosphatase family metal-dependent hydrolase